MRILFKNASADIPASVVVFLIALPLSLGIALGSGAPLFSGIIAGMVGSAVMVVYYESKYLVGFRKDISFLNKPIVKEKLEAVPADSYILIDISRADFIDKDIIDVVNEFLQYAHLKNITIEIKKSRFKSGHQLVYDQSTIHKYAGSSSH